MSTTHYINLSVLATLYSVGIPVYTHKPFGDIEYAPSSDPMRFDAFFLSLDLSEAPDDTVISLGSNASWDRSELVWPANQRVEVKLVEVRFTRAETGKNRWMAKIVRINNDMLPELSSHRGAEIFAGMLALYEDLGGEL